MNFISLLFISFLISAVLSSIVAAFTKIPYKNKFASQLSRVENAIKNGNASFSDRIKLFSISVFASIFAPPVYLKAIVIFIVLYFIN